VFYTDKEEKDNKTPRSEF